ncbi:hypothetical protein [Frankia sp. AgW1.1]|uniref:hypothetical protein n=1 Tax=Frankia sp. AgW1.1 TaxID=1836971 RepID=UPI0019328DE5|nr:hypothetical protein [Frankia sp. AgW1.1]MBL7493074.1 hypothetical protein [Frankia sp. AgW1.1]
MLAAVAVPVGLLDAGIRSGGSHAAAKNATDTSVSARPPTATATSAPATPSSGPATTPAATPTGATSARTPQTVVSSAGAGPTTGQPQTAPGTTRPAASSGQAGQAGPAGPGTDANYQAGSSVSVAGCAGWLDFSDILYGTLSAGAASCAADVITTSDTLGDSTVRLTAENYAEKNSAPGGFLYFGYYKLSVHICIWNVTDAGHKQCSATYTDTQGTVTRG